MSRWNTVQRVTAAARQAGLYVLRGPGTLEFLSLATGRRAAIWVRRTGVLLDAASNRVGRTGSPFGALNLAVRLDRQARGAVPAHQRPRDGPRRAEVPVGHPGRAGRD
jgi:hypothetical protein